MKLKLTLPIAVFLTLLTVALCTGSQLFLLLSILILLILTVIQSAIYYVVILFINRRKINLD